MNEYNQNEQKSGDNWGGGTPGGQSGYFSAQNGWQTPNGGAPGGRGGYQAQEPQSPYQFNISDYDAPAQKSGKKTVRPGKRGLAVFFSIIAVVLLLSVVSFAGYGAYVMLSGNNFIYNNSTPASPLPSGLPQTGVGENAPKLPINVPPSEGELSNEAIAAKVLPSVVRISNYQESSPYGVVDEGTGIIVSSQGYIVTNAHVVENASGLQISLPSGEDFVGVVVGADVATDLAVVKIDPKNVKLVAAEFGDSSKLQVGERVIAIGNAGGSEFSGSVTSGIVSALEREISTSSTKLTVLQTDAAINPGNSGGPLVNKFGQVVGINSAKLIKEGYEGLGFAIPTNNAKPIIDDLLENGRVTGRCRIGVMGRDISEVIAQMMGSPAGVQVVSVDIDCDIAKQGVVPGDILVKMGNQPLTMAELKSLLLQHRPGDKVEIEVYRPNSPQGGRGGKTFKVNVTLDEDTGESNFPQERATPQPDAANPYALPEGLPNYGGDYGYGAMPQYPNQPPYPSQTPQPGQGGYEDFWSQFPFTPFG